MDRTEAFTQHRPLLFSIAYRMLSSVMDAEDMVQETFLRWQQVDDTGVRSPKSYLSTVVTRLCIDQLRSARLRREEYIGPWLPEPLVTAGLEEDVALADSISMAFLVVLESLSPTERAAFLLREVFDYEYDEVARILDKSEANCRQLVHRAREHVSERRPRFDASREEAEAIARRFFEAARTGDMDALLDMLAPDATLWSDGGGKVSAAINPVYGARKVARFVAGVNRKAPPNTRSRMIAVNGQPGVVSYLGDEPYVVAVADIVDGKVCGIRAISNPDKLQRLPRLSQAQ
ncbi:MAG: RNA polymerase sigma-70 factor [Dehalococcoidia bacterium]